MTLFKALRELLRKEDGYDHEAAVEQQRREDEARLAARTEADQKRNLFPPWHVQQNQPKYNKPPKR